MVASLFSPSGVRGNLQESERYVGASLVITGATLLLTVYFLVWQSYVLRADVIMNSILLCIYGLSGAAGFGSLARFTRLDFRRSDGTALHMTSNEYRDKEGATQLLSCR